MKYIFAFFGMIVNISTSFAFQVEYKIGSHSPEIRTEYEYQKEETVMVDFGQNIAQKRSHIVQVFPKDVAYSVYQGVVFTKETPELELLFSQFGRKKIESFITSHGYPCGSYNASKKIFLHGRIPCEYDSHTHSYSYQDMSTNALTTIEYDFDIMRDDEMTLKIFPFDPESIYVADPEAYLIYGLSEGRQSFLEEYPELWKEMPDSSVRMYHFQQPFRLLGADLDIYDISVQINGENIVVVPIRKYRFTAFSEFLLDFYHIYADSFFTLLPYYEIRIPIQNGKNTVQFSYKHWYDITRNLCENERCRDDRMHTIDFFEKK